MPKTRSISFSGMLRSAGHEITTVDLASCGVNPKRIDEIDTIHDYVEPLMELMASLPPHKRVILVGHSLGGVALFLAMEKFPQKISTAIFVAALMPSLEIPQLLIYGEEIRRLSSTMDGEFDSKLLFMGPKLLASKLYQCCPPEDYTLATMLLRPGKLFEDEFSKESTFSKENFGSVSRVFIVCKEDEFMKEDLQRSIIARNPPEDVMEIEGADHMVMLSKPK